MELGIVAQSVLFLTSQNNCVSSRIGGNLLITRVEKFLALDQLQAVRSMLSDATFDPCSPGALRSHLALGKNAHRSLEQVIQSTAVASRKFAVSTMPKEISAANFYRHEAGMYRNSFADPAVVQQMARIDLVAMIFLTDGYMGGELVVDNTEYDASATSRAGDLIAFPANLPYEITEITAGVRDTAVFWVQSVIRDPEKRRILTKLNNIHDALIEKDPTNLTAFQLGEAHSNLLRMWVS